MTNKLPEAIGTSKLPERQINGSSDMVAAAAARVVT